MTWQPRNYGEGLRMAWDEDDDGIDHCLAKIEPYLPLVGVVLDIGCGVGRLTVPLATPERLMIGFDTSEEMLTLAHQQSADIAWVSVFPDYFDFAFSVVTFQHISDDEMRGYLRAVADADAGIVFQFVAGSEREPLSMQRHTEDVGKWCYSAGFRVVDVWPDDRFPNWRWVHAR